MLCNLCFGAPNYDSRSFVLRSLISLRSSGICTWRLLNGGGYSCSCLNTRTTSASYSGCFERYIGEIRSRVYIARVTSAVGEPGTDIKWQSFTSSRPSNLP